MFDKYRTQGLRCLTDPEAEIFTALADTVFPDGTGMDTSASAAGVLEWVDEYLDQLPTMKRLQLRAMFIAFEADYAVFARDARARFSAADPEARTDYLRYCDEHPLYLRRSPFQALKSVLMLAYLRAPEVQRQVGITRGEVALKKLAQKVAVAEEVPAAPHPDTPAQEEPSS